MTGPRPAKTTCKSCGEPIIWALTENSKRMPVDAEPDETGTLVLSPGPQPTATVVSKGGREPGVKLYRSHFGSCRAADRHRKPVAARRITPPAMPQDGLFSEVGR